LIDSIKTDRDLERDPLTSEVGDDIPLLRMDVQPSVENGLQMPAHVAADRINTFR
jgi:hypothetical protein